MVGNNAHGRISKRVFQENKGRQIFQKTNIFLPPNTHFEIRPFALLPTRYKILLKWKKKLDPRMED